MHELQKLLGFITFYTSFQVKNILLHSTKYLPMMPLSMRFLWRYRNWCRVLLMDIRYIFVVRNLLFMTSYLHCPFNGCLSAFHDGLNLSLLFVSGLHICIWSNWFRQNLHHDGKARVHRAERFNTSFSGTDFSN